MRLTGDSPDDAAPRIFTGPGDIVCLSMGLTITDLGRSELTAVMSAGSTAAPVAIVCTG
jgi:hypothetical protein